MRETRQSEVHILRVLTGYVLTYLAYNPLVITLVIGVVFVMIVLINFTGGDLTYIGFDKFAQLMTGWGIEVKETYNLTDLLNFFSIASLILAIISSILNKLLKTDTKNKWVSSYKTRFVIGVMIINLLMLLAEVSTIFPRAANGAETTRWIMLIMWFISVVSYLIHVVLMSVARKIS